MNPPVSIMKRLIFTRACAKATKTHIGEFGTPYIINADKPLEEVWTEVVRAVESIV